MVIVRRLGVDIDLVLAKVGSRMAGRKIVLDMDMDMDMDMVMDMGIEKAGSILGLSRYSMSYLA